MDTFSPSRRVQKRRHGYLARLRTRSGRAILKRRMLKGRKYLSW
jgi:large subunit ribosomal protein L34